MVPIRVPILENFATHEPTVPRSLSRRSQAQVGEGGSAYAEPGEGSPHGSSSQWAVRQPWPLPMNRTQVIARGLPGTPHPNPLPKGERMSCGAREMLESPRASNANSCPENLRPNPPKYAERFPPLPLAGEGRGEGSFRSAVHGPRAGERASSDTAGRATCATTRFRREPSRTVTFSRPQVPFMLSACSH